MKKFLLFFLIIGCSAAIETNYFAWSALSTNQAVSYYSLNDAVSNSVFPCAGFVGSPTSKILTKSAAIATNVLFDKETTNFKSLGNNDVVIKSDFQPYPFNILIARPSSTTHYNTLYDAAYETSAPNYWVAAYAHESPDIGKIIRLYTNFTIDTTKFYSAHGLMVGYQLGVWDLSKNEFIIKDLLLQL